MKKIIFVLLLAVLMLFVSCGKSESKTSSTSGTATETSTKTAEKKKIEINVDELETIQETAVPSVSLNVAEKAIIKMSTIVDHNVKETRNFFINKGQAEDKENLSQSESLINSLDNKITTYSIFIN